MDLEGIEDHPLVNYIPIRLPVEWYVKGEVGVKPSIDGVTGKLVTIEIAKKFTRIEKVLAKILRAPKVLKRRLDRHNSMLWELMDGEREFGEICKIMDSLYHEEVSPVIERVALGINAFRQLNLATILFREEE